MLPLEKITLTLDNIAAADKPKGWHIDYLNPTRMTIRKLTSG
jgi:Uri superfamily endonuclease